MAGGHRLARRPPRRGRHHSVGLLGLDAARRGRRARRPGGDDALGVQRVPRSRLSCSVLEARAHPLHQRRGRAAGDRRWGRVVGGFGALAGRPILRPDRGDQDRQDLRHGRSQRGPAALRGTASPTPPRRRGHRRLPGMARGQLQQPGYRRPPDHPLWPGRAQLHPPLQGSHGLLSTRLRAGAAR